MILNHDYVRDILLYVEKNLNYKSDEEVPTHHKKLDHSRLPDKEQFKNYDKDTLMYAIELLIQEQYLQCAKPPKYHEGDLLEADIIGLSWKGHELLDNVRDDNVWNAVKERARSFGQFSIKTLSTIAGQLTVKLMTDPNALQNLISIIK